MKKIAFILLLFSCSFGWAQQFVLVEKPTEEKNVTSEEDYNKLLNYTPKSFVSNIKTKPNNPVLEGDLNSINSLELRYAYQEQLKLSASEIKWMEDEINQLATAYFKEKKLIIIKKTGNVGNCIDRDISTEKRKRYTFITIKFCYSFPGAEVFEDNFLAIFNKRTEQLIAENKKIKKLLKRD